MQSNKFDSVENMKQTSKTIKSVKQSINLPTAASLYRLQTLNTTILVYIVQSSHKAHDYFCFIDMTVGERQEAIKKKEALLMCLKTGNLQMQRAGEKREMSHL